MKEFKDKFILTISGGAMLLLVGIVLLVMAGLFIGLIIYLPTQLIAPYSEKWATTWVVFVLGSMVVFAVYNDVKRWFIWQLVDPFKKAKQ